MLLTITRDNLNAGLSATQKASSSSSSQISLTGILIETVDSGSVRLTGTDLQIRVECIVPCLVDRPGSVILPAKLLYELARKLPPGDVQLDFSSVEDGLVIKPLASRNAVFSLRTLVAEDFPESEELTGASQVELSCGILKGLIRMTVFATSSEDTRPSLTGVYLTFDDGYIRMVATDSWRLSLCQHKPDSDNSDAESSTTGITASAIIPARTLNELNRLLTADEDIARLSLTQNHVSIETSNIRVVSRLIEGQFPNYRAILPKGHKATLSVDRLQLLATAERAVLMVKEKMSLIRLSNTGEMLIAAWNSADAGKGYEEIPIVQEGEEVKIVVDAHYLVDSLRALDCEKVLIKLQGSLQALCLGEEDNTNFIHLIMPVKVQT